METGKNFLSKVGSHTTPLS